MLKSSYRKILNLNFRPLDEAHGKRMDAIKMNKEQSADDPSVDLIRKKKYA